MFEVACIIYIRNLPRMPRSYPAPAINFLYHSILILCFKNFFIPLGTNVTEARNILKNSGMVIETADDLDEAARKAVGCLA